MRPVVVHGGPAGDRGGFGSRDYRHPSPVQQRRLHSYSQRASSGQADAGFGNRELITERIRVGRGPALGEVGKVTIFGRKPTRPALNFTGTVTASRNRIPGSARIKPLQKSLRCFADRFHFTPSAPLRGLAAGFDGHEPDRRKIGNVRKAVGEIRNVER